MLYYHVVSVLPWGSWLNHMAKTHYAHKIEDLMDKIFAHPLHLMQGTVKHKSSISETSFKTHWDCRLCVIVMATFNQDNICGTFSLQ